VSAHSAAAAALADPTERELLALLAEDEALFVARVGKD
jgi:hypothetical protein